MTNRLRKTKIVCTIGPASESEEKLQRLFKAGVNVCRLNFSHGTHREHKERIDRIKAVREKTGHPVAILLDTKGPEIRLGKFKDGKVNLIQGQEFVLTTRDVPGSSSCCTISYTRLPQEVQPGNRILINDGLVELRVLNVLNDTDVECVAINNGVLSDNKGVNIPHLKINLPFLSDKDTADILFGVEQGVDYIAASFTQSADDIMQIRHLLHSRNSSIGIVAKIENQEGMDHVKSILEVADGIMVARGDLGVEIKPETIPLAQKKIIKQANLMGKPVITATQMLESMTTFLRPTRAEVSDVATAIFDGTSAVMLSGETAVGQNPVESVEMMHSIAMTIENTLDYEKTTTRSRVSHAATPTNALAGATCSVSSEIRATAIITATASGATARAISKFRPRAPIVAITYSPQVCRQLSLAWGVYPLLSEMFDSTDMMFRVSADAARNAGYVKTGDLTVITAGVPTGQKGTTNLLKIHQIT